ncbi:MAG: insulinase family protein [Gemmatimonadaceae bacterium]|nr:insulinase family protein [Gemmatimonadaceae bacterium]
MSVSKHADPFPADRVVRIVLRNGLKALLLPDSTAPVAAVVTRVNAGYFDETDDIVGIAHVLEHMFFKGTQRRGVGDIAKETKASGGYLNAHTIYDNTTYYTVLPASGLRAGLEIQADAYANSVIDADELARELEVIIQEAKRKLDNPSAVATETTYELLHDTHRMRRWRIGREAGLRQLGRDQLLRFYRNFYRPSNTILAVAGDFDAAEISQEIERLYGQLEAADPVRTPGPPETSTAGFRYRELSGDIAQSQVVIGWRTPDAHDDDTPALDVAASILASGRASRLYRAVRERKLASSISAYNYTPTELGVFALHIEGDAATAVEAAQAAWSEILRLRKEAPSDPELQRVKNVFASRWMRRLETMEGKANYLAEWEGLGDWQLGSRYFQRVMDMSAQDVSAASSKYLQPESAAVLVYRPVTAPSVATDGAAMRHLLQLSSVTELKPLAAANISVASAKKVKAEDGESGVRVFRSSSGIPVLVKKRPSPIVHMEIQAAGGSSRETMEIAGISNLAARTSVKGTPRFSSEQIASLAEEMGGSIGVSVGRDSVSWSLSVPVKFFERAFNLVADVVLGPTLSDTSVDIERHAALSNLALLRDDMYSYPVRLATLAAFAGHPYGIPVSGTEETVRAFDGAAVRMWYNGTMMQTEWTVGIVGDVDPEVAAAIVSGALADLQQGGKPETRMVSWPLLSASTIETRDKAQTALALAFNGAHRNDPDRYAAAMIATVASGLGGRFFEELRDKRSLAYTVHAFNSAHPAAGMFLSYIATSPEKEDAAREGLLEQFAELTNSRVSDDELERAKRYAIGTHAIAQESGGHVLNEILSAYTFGLGLTELEEYESSIQKVTAEQMREFARKHFDPTRRVEGVIRGAGRVV